MVEYLRDLARYEHEQCGGPGVGTMDSERVSRQDRNPPCEPANTYPQPPIRTRSSVYASAQRRPRCPNRSVPLRITFVLQR